MNSDEENSHSTVGRSDIGTPADAQNANFGTSQTTCLASTASFTGANGSSLQFNNASQNSSNGSNSNMQIGVSADSETSNSFSSWTLNREVTSGSLNSHFSMLPDEGAPLNSETSQTFDFGSSQGDIT